MKRTLLALIIGIVIGFILAEVVSLPYQVSSSASPTGWGSIKINRLTGQAWILIFENGAIDKPYWEKIGNR